MPFGIGRITRGDAAGLGGAGFERRIGADTHARRKGDAQRADLLCFGNIDRHAEHVGKELRQPRRRRPAAGDRRSAEIDRTMSTAFADVQQ